jgi:Ulp1 family protease catalytic subunit
MDVPMTPAPVVKATAPKRSSKPAGSNFQYGNTLNQTPASLHQQNLRTSASKLKTYGTNRRRQENDYGWRGGDEHELGGQPPTKRLKVTADPESIQHPDPYTKKAVMVPEHQNSRSNDSQSDDDVRMLSSQNVPPQRTTTPQRPTPRPKNFGVSDISSYRSVENKMSAKVSRNDESFVEGHGKTVVQVVIKSPSSGSQYQRQHYELSDSEKREPLTQKKDQFSIKGASKQNGTVDGFMKPRSYRRERSATVELDDADELAEDQPDYHSQHSKFYNNSDENDEISVLDIPKAVIKQQRNINRSSPSRAEDSCHLISARWLYNTWGNCTLHFEEIAGRKQIRLHMDAYLSKQHIVESGKVLKVLFADNYSTVRLTGPRYGTTGQVIYYHLEFLDSPSVEWFTHKIRTLWRNVGFCKRDEEWLKRVIKNVEGEQHRLEPSSHAADAGQEEKFLARKIDLRNRMESERQDEISPEIPSGERLKHQLLPLSQSRRTVNLSGDKSRTPQMSNLEVEMTGGPRTRASQRKAQRLTRIDSPSPELEPVHYDLGPPWNSPVVFRSQLKRSAIVDFSDLSRLNEGEYLNDNLISFYLNWLEDQYTTESSQVYFFTTYFYSTLTSQRGKINHKAVEKWTKSVDVFNYDFLVVPVNEAFHWYLAIICNLPNLRPEPATESSPSPEIVSSNAVGDTSTRRSPPSNYNNRSELKDSVYSLLEGSKRHTEPYQANVNQLSSDNRAEDDNIILVEPPNNETHRIPRPQRLLSKPAKPKDGQSRVAKKPKGRIAPVRKLNPTEPYIIILDSLGSPHPNTVKNLKEYLVAEAFSKRGMTITKDDFKGVTAKGIPQQPDFNNCGIYLCAYVEKFLKGPRSFVDKLLKHEFDTLDWVDLDARQSRRDIRKLLMSMYYQQEAERQIVSAAKSAKKKDQRCKTPKSATNGKAATPPTPSKTPSDIQAARTPPGVPPPMAHQFARGEDYHIPEGQQITETEPRVEAEKENVPENEEASAIVPSTSPKMNEADRNDVLVPATQEEISTYSNEEERILDTQQTSLRYAVAAPIDLSRPTSESPPSRSPNFLSLSKPSEMRYSSEIEETDLSSNDGGRVAFAQPLDLSVPSLSRERARYASDREISNSVEDDNSSHSTADWPRTAWSQPLDLSVVKSRSSSIDGDASLRQDPTEIRSQTVDPVQSAANFEVKQEGRYRVEIPETPSEIRLEGAGLSFTSEIDLNDIAQDNPFKRSQNAPPPDSDDDVKYIPSPPRTFNDPIQPIEPPSPRRSRRNTTSSKKSADRRSRPSRDRSASPSSSKMKKGKNRK